MNRLLARVTIAIASVAAAFGGFLVATVGDEFEPRGSIGTGLLVIGVATGAIVGLQSRAR